MRIRKYKRRSSIKKLLGIVRSVSAIIEWITIALAAQRIASEVEQICRKENCFPVHTKTE